MKRTYLALSNEDKDYLKSLSKKELSKLKL